ncbi:hypothetical protein C8A05DRAFT_40705 [Staphylotrichum tortipilum]|uniref:Core domain-containing protein n=1 Tax=Staphylotrichum tortipilum TaxID=2831512 RepID=A0AAN6MSU1_9PEZI|nr:hypothetical protein C8A05DRAFT_40705 [Staphylotrichum longicolle]
MPKFYLSQKPLRRPADPSQRTRHLNNPADNRASPSMPRLRCADAPATASLFIQLSMRRQPLSAGLPILDLLLPLRRPPTVITRSVRSHHAASGGGIANTRHLTPSSGAQLPRAWDKTRPPTILPNSSPAAFNSPVRAFSSSSPWRATHAIFNPQMDDDGKDMMLEITPRAAQRLSKIMTQDSNPNLALRIQVESGGCHGFQYLMKLVTLPPSLPTKDSPAPAAEDDSSAAIRKDDTIFTYASDESPSPGDLTSPKIILDLPSLDLLKGSKVDFTMELIGSQFKIVDNPLATSSCGCGTSFDIKI